MEKLNQFGNPYRKLNLNQMNIIENIDDRIDRSNEEKVASEQVVQIASMALFLAQTYRI